MDIREMKNMVVLKNLPSNVVEEAFVVLKKDVNIQKLEVLENNKNIKRSNKENDKNDFAVKEAEIILKEYIDKIEGKDILKSNKNITKKYEKLKYLTIFLGILSTLLIVLNLIK